MSPAALLLAAATAGAVAALLVGERGGDRTLQLLAKPLASACFVALGIVRLAPGDPAGAWIVLALVLCAVGDVLLLFDRAFLAGLVVFLLGHLGFLAAFHAMQPASLWPVALVAPPFAVSAVATAWLWPHLGRLRPAVLAYVTVITVMVWGALAVVLDAAVPARLAVGAGLFYLSDLSVARDRFVERAFVNRAWGLPAYYAGQLLLALSVGVT